MRYSPSDAVIILVSRPVEAVQLVIKITKELHGENVLSSLLQLSRQVGDIKLTIMIVLVLLDPQISAWRLDLSM